MGFFGGYDDWAPPGTQDYIGAARNMVNTDYRKPNEIASQKLLNHLYGDPSSPKYQLAWNQIQADPGVAAALQGIDTGAREATRNYDMSTAMLPPGQAALRAANKGVMDTRMADIRGATDINAVNSAIGNRRSMAEGGEARNVQIGQEGMQDWLGGLNQYKRVYNPGIFDRIGQIAGLGGQLIGDIGGLGGLGQMFNPGGNLQSGGFRPPSGGGLVQLPTSGSSMNPWFG